MNREAEAKQVIGPYHAHIREIFGAAEGHWMKLPEQQRGILMLNKRTHANVMWQFVVHEATSRFEGTGIVAKVGVNTITFSCRNKVLMRFKKISASGLSSNYQTQTAMDFNMMQLVMPGMPEAIRVDLGYVLDPDTFRITELRVVHRNGNTVAWQYTIPEAEEGAGGITPTSAPAAPVDGSTSRVRVVVPQVGKAADAASA